MIRITYTAQDRALAEQIRDDLTGSFESSPPLLIVLVSAASNQDPVVAAEPNAPAKAAPYSCPY